MVLDYTWERREELIRAEEYEDGRQDGMKAGILLGRAEGEKTGMRVGIKQGELNILLKLAASGVITVEQAANEAGMDVATFKQRMKE